MQTCFVDLRFLGLILGRGKGGGGGKRIVLTPVVEREA